MIEALFKNLICVCILTVLSGCQTITAVGKSPSDKNGISREEKSTEVSLDEISDNKPHYSFVEPKEEILSLSYDKYGSVRIGMKGALPRETNQLHSAFKSTLAGHTGKKDPRLSLLTPRDSYFQLGTVFSERRKKDPWYLYDEGYAKTLASNTQTTRVSQAVFHGAILEQALRMVIDKTPKAQSIYEKAIGKPKASIFTNWFVTVSARNIKTDYLPADVTRSLSSKISSQVSYEKRGEYFVLDKIVWADEINIYIGPGRFKDNPINRNKNHGFDTQSFLTAVKNRPDAKKINGVWVLQQKFNQPKIVAVGFSLLPSVSKIGDRWLDISMLPSLADVYPNHSEEGELLQQ